MTGYFSSPFPRRPSVSVDVGGVMVGGGAPVVVQSMTNTDTADIDQTVSQVAALAEAGSEIVRVTVDRDESASAVPHIRERLDPLRDRLDAGGIHSCPPGDTRRSSRDAAR